MNCYYWKNAITSPDLLNEYQNEISKLLGGSYSRSDLKKLKSTVSPSIYRLKLNSKDRLIFTIHHHCLHILEIIKSHDYQKSRFLKKGVLKKYIGNYEESFDFGTLFIALQETEPKPDFQLKNPSGIYSPLTYYNQKFIEISDEQNALIQSIQLPAIVNGAPGSGKTLVGTMMIAEINEGRKVLYVTKELRLVQTTQENYEGFLNSDSEGLADFKTIDSLFRSLLNGVDPVATNKEFVDPLYSQEVISKIYSFREMTCENIYREFRICSGFSREEYLNLGRRQSLIKDLDLREKIYSAYEDFIERLDNENKIDLSFPSKMINGLLSPQFATAIEEEEKPQKYDLIVVDESQNLSLGQLFLLFNLAKNHAVVFLMDTNQNLHDRIPSLDLLKIMLYKEMGYEPHVQCLSKTYRSSRSIVDVLNAMLRFKRQLSGGSVNKRETIELEIDCEAELGGFYLKDSISNGDSQSWINERKGRLAVVTTQDEVEAARELFNTPLVFTVEEIQGQEFHTVVVYKLFPNHLKFEKRTDGDASNLAKEGLANTSFLTIMNEYFTACSRAIHTLVIVQEEKRGTREFFETLKNLQSSMQLDSLTFSDTVDWDEIIQTQTERGNYAVVERIKLDQQTCKIDGGALEFSASSLETPSLQKFDANLGKQLLKILESTTSLNGKKFKKIKELLARTDLDLNQANEMENTPLMLTVIGDHQRVLDELLKCGDRIDPNIRRKSDGATALILALRLNRSECVETLLNDRRVILNITMKDGRDVVMLAEQNPNPRFIEMFNRATRESIGDDNQSLALNSLVKKKTSPSRVGEEKRPSRSLQNFDRKLGAQFLKFFESSYQLTEKLLKDINKALKNEKLDLNQVNRVGDTALISACRNNWIRVVEALLSKGNLINLDYRKPDGSTALMFAVELNHLEIVRMLLNSGTQHLNYQFSDGATLLIKAIKNRNPAMVQILVDTDDRIDLNHTSDRNGLSALTFAIKVRETEIIKILIKAGRRIDLNQRMKFETEETPLMSAICGSSIEVVQELINAGNCIDLNLKQKDGFTALMIAIELDKPKVVQMLLNTGSRIDLHTKNNEGIDAWTFAVNRQRGKIKEMIIQRQLGWQVNDN